MANIKLIFGIIFGVLLITTVNAASIPDSITLPLYIKSLATNESPTQDIDFSFRVYTSLTGGSPILIQNSTLSVSNGIATATLTSTNLSYESQYFLGVIVNGSIEMTPRIAFTTSPYAYISNTSIDLMKKVGALTNGKICTANGTSINCNMDSKVGNSSAEIQAIFYPTLGTYINSSTIYSLLNTYANSTDVTSIGTIYGLLDTYANKTYVTGLGYQTVANEYILLGTYANQTWVTSGFIAAGTKLGNSSEEIQAVYYPTLATYANTSVLALYQTIANEYALLNTYANQSFVNTSSYTPTSVLYTILNTYTNSTTLSDYETIANEYILLNTYANQSWVLSRGFAQNNWALNTTVLQNESGSIGIVKTFFDGKYIAVGTKLGNSSAEIQAAELDAAHDECTEISGCVVGATTLASVYSLLGTYTNASALNAYTNTAGIYSLLNTYANSTSLSGYQTIANEYTLLNTYANQTWVSSQSYLTEETDPTVSSALSGYANQTWVTSRGYATSQWGLNTTVLQNESGNIGIVKTWFDSKYITVGTKLGNSSAEIQAAELDAAHDTCSEISGCVVGASTTASVYSLLTTYINTTTANANYIPKGYAYTNQGVNTTSSVKFVDVHSDDWSNVSITTAQVSGLPSKWGNSSAEIQAVYYPTLATYVNTSTIYSLLDTYLNATDATTLDTLYTTLQTYANISSVYSLLGTYANSTALNAYTNTAGVYALFNTYANQTWVTSRGYVQNNWALNTTVLQNESGNIGIVKTYFDANYIAVGTKLGNSSTEIQAVYYPTLSTYANQTWVTSRGYATAQFGLNTTVLQNESGNIGIVKTFFDGKYIVTGTKLGNSSAEIQAVYYPTLSTYTNSTALGAYTNTAGIYSLLSTYINTTTSNSNLYTTLSTYLNSTTAGTTYVDVVGDTMTGNLINQNNVTAENFVLEVDTTNHRIYDNSTCTIMRGDTATLEVC